jgi:type II secretory pathway pseudopilin PulG
MLFAALLAIAAAAILPDVVFQAKRDREEELIHRGVQYSRAIRKYVKKFGRYPTSLEDLENTNQLRFLRKRYKDPLTGKDFKLLHLGEVQATFGAGLTGATAATALSRPVNSATAQQGEPGQGSSDGSARAPDSTSGAGTQDAAGGATASSPGDNNQHPDALSGQVFGGGPIVGVASTSKDKTIREFNKKNKYNEWQFIYDPTSDRGGLLSTPNQPPLQGAAGVVPGAAGAVPGQNGQPAGQLWPPPTQQPQTPQQPSSPPPN